MTVPSPPHPSDAHAPAVARRTVVLGGAVASAALLAACSSSSPGAAAGSATTGSQAPSAADSPTPTAATTQPPGTTVLGPAAQVPVGGGTVFEAAGQPVMVTQPTAGTYHGFSAVCPHEGCACNAVEQGVIVCPCHGSTFSAETGDVLSPPARTGLQRVDVAVQGSDIVLV